MASIFDTHARLTRGPHVARVPGSGMVGRPTGRPAGGDCPPLVASAMNTQPGCVDDAELGGGGVLGPMAEADATGRVGMPCTAAALQNAAAAAVAFATVQRPGIVPPPCERPTTEPCPPGPVAVPAVPGIAVPVTPGCPPCAGAYTPTIATRPLPVTGPVRPFPPFATRPITARPGITTGPVRRPLPVRPQIAIGPAVTGAVTGVVNGVVNAVIGLIKPVLSRGPSRPSRPVYSTGPTGPILVGGSGVPITTQAPTAMRPQITAQVQRVPTTRLITTPTMMPRAVSGLGAFGGGIFASAGEPVDADSQTNPLPVSRRIVPQIMAQCPPPKTVTCPGLPTPAVPMPSISEPVPTPVCPPQVAPAIVVPPPAACSGFGWWR